MGEYITAARYVEFSSKLLQSPTLLHEIRTVIKCALNVKEDQSGCRMNSTAVQLKSFDWSIV